MVEGLGPEEDSMDQVTEKGIRCYSYRERELTWIVSARVAFGASGLSLDEPGEQDDDDV